MIYLGFKNRIFVLVQINLITQSYIFEDLAVSHVLETLNRGLEKNTQMFQDDSSIFNIYLTYGIIP